MAKTDSPDPFTLRTVGEAIRIIRQRAGVSRDALANGAGIAGGSLSRLEADQTARPSPAMIRAVMDALAEAMDVDPDDFWQQFEAFLIDRERERANRYLAAQVRALRGRRPKG